MQSDDPAPVPEIVEMLALVFEAALIREEERREEYHRLYPPKHPPRPDFPSVPLDGFATYEEAVAFARRAQPAAWGISKNESGLCGRKPWQVFGVPSDQRFRTGHELRCEIVEMEARDENENR